MLPKLFLLFLSSSMGYLTHFTDITTRFKHTGGYYTGPSQIVDNNTTDEQEVEAYCAKACLEAKYFCKVFMVMTKPLPFCTLFAKPVSELVYHHEKTCGPLTIFELSKSEYVEPIVDRFSHNLHPESQWIEEGYGFGYLEKEYGSTKMSKGIFENIMKGYTLATKSQPSTALARNFLRIAASELEAFSDQEGAKPTAESIANILFTFLDLFCPHLHQNIKTIYDPTKNQLFITGPNIHILVVSFGPSDYAIVQDVPNDPGKSLVFVSNKRRLPESSDTGSESVTGSESDIDDVDSESDIEDNVDSESDIEDNVDSESDIEDDVDSESDIKDDIDSESEIEDDVDSESDIKDDVDSESDIKDDVDSDVDTDYISHDSGDINDNDIYNFYTDLNSSNVDSYVDPHYVPHDIVALFQQAMKTPFENVNAKYDYIDYGRELDIGGQGILLLNYILHALLEPGKLTNIYAGQLNGVEHIFYRDLVTAVLSKVYENGETATFRSRLHARVNNKFSDISFNKQ